MTAVMIGVMVVVMVVGIFGLGGHHGGTGSGHHGRMEREYEYTRNEQKHPEPVALRNDLDVIRPHDRETAEEEGLKQVSMIVNDDNNAAEDSKFDGEKENAKGEKDLN